MIKGISINKFINRAWKKTYNKRFLRGKMREGIRIEIHKAIKWLLIYTKTMILINEINSIFLQISILWISQVLDL